mmetsp:Transcript_23671/g.76967  ORF Transcript_23671/g.76967 Transcript_23671/m.76967 type:complete len:457 (+) Transcript_23671:2397-3767(+)
MNLRRCSSRQGHSSALCARATRTHRSSNRPVSTDVDVKKVGDLLRDVTSSLVGGCRCCTVGSRAVGSGARGKLGGGLVGAEAELLVETPARGALLGRGGLRRHSARPEPERRGARPRDARELRRGLERAERTLRGAVAVARAEAVHRERTVRGGDLHAVRRLRDILARARDERGPALLHGRDLRVDRARVGAEAERGGGGLAVRGLLPEPLLRVVHRRTRAFEPEQVLVEPFPHRNLGVAHSRTEPQNGRRLLRRNLLRPQRAHRLVRPRSWQARNLFLHSLLLCESRRRPKAKLGRRPVGRLLLRPERARSDVGSRPRRVRRELLRRVLLGDELLGGGELRVEAVGAPEPESRSGRLVGVLLLAELATLHARMRCSASAPRSPHLRERHGERVQRRRLPLELSHDVRVCVRMRALCVVCVCVMRGTPPPRASSRPWVVATLLQAVSLITADTALD